MAKKSTVADPKPQQKPTAVSDKKAPDRKVKYEKIDAYILEGSDAMLVQKAKDLLGWQENTDDDDFGDDYQFVDFYKKKIRCMRNMANRPFNTGWAERLAQDILRGNWRFNGESIIIGKYGSVLSGQHRLVALVLAEQERTDEKRADYWQKKHPEPLALECVLVTGVEEDGRTTRTLDNVMPRTLSDVLFCDNNIFGKKTPKERKTLCHMMDMCVRTLWDRTGAVNDAWAPRRTHSEALDFIERHKRVLECVAHIFEEDKATHSIGQYVSPGVASGLMYLMAQGTSDEQDYKDKNGVTSEKKLDWELWDKAVEFWTLLADEESSTRELRHALAALVDPVTGVGGRIVEKVATVCKAWNLFKNGEEITQDAIALDMPEDKEGKRHLIECVSVGGIDLGNKISKIKEEDQEEASEAPQDLDDLPVPEEPEESEVEEVETAKNAVKEAKLTRIKERKVAPMPQADAYEVGWQAYEAGPVNKCEGPFTTLQEAQAAADSLNFEDENDADSWPRWAVAPVGVFEKVGAAKTSEEANGGSKVKAKKIVRKP